MFLQTPLLSFSEKNNFYPKSIEWISLDKFFIIKNKNISFYSIKNQNNVWGLQDCFNIIQTVSEISLFRIFLKPEFFVLVTCDGAFFFRNLRNKKTSRIFFSDLCILDLHYDRTHSEIFYLLTTKQRNDPLLEPSGDLFNLSIFNRDQKKILKIMNFPKKRKSQIFFRFLPKKNLIIIIHHENIFFFFLNWASKKIFLKKISHTSEICSFFLFGEFLLISDRKGCLLLYNFQNDTGGYLSVIKNKSTIFSRKIVKLSFGAFSFLTHLDNSNVLLNVKGECEILRIKSGKVYRKKISFLSYHEKIIDLKKNTESFQKFLVTNTKGVFLLILKKPNLVQNILKFENFHHLGKNVCNFDFSNLKIKIFHCPSISSRTFLVFGLENLIQFFHFEKTCVNRKYFNIKKTQGSSDNFTKNLTGCSVAMGKFLFFTDGRFFFKIITSKIDFGPFVPQSGDWEFKSACQNVSKKSNGNNLIFHKNGNKVGIKLSDYCFKFYEYVYTSGFLSPKKKFLMFFRKKCLAASFSENGLLFVCAFSSSLTVWKIHPNFERKKTIGLEIKGKIEKARFLSGKNENLVIVSSHRELLIWDFVKNKIQFRLKLKIFNMETNQIDESFLLCTEYYQLSRIINNKIFAVFKSKNDVPLAIFSPDIFSHRTILTLNFYYGFTKKKKNRLVFLDNFLDLHQLLF